MVSDQTTLFVLFKTCILMRYWVRREDHSVVIAACQLLVCSIIVDHSLCYLRTDGGMRPAASGAYITTAPPRLLKKLRSLYIKISLYNPKANNITKRGYYLILIALKKLKKKKKKKRYYNNLEKILFINKIAIKILYRYFPFYFIYR